MRLLVQAPVGVLYLYLFRDAPVRLCPVFVFGGGVCLYDHLIFLLKIALCHGLLLYRPSTVCAAGTHVPSPKKPLCVCWRQAVCRDTSPTATTEWRAVHVFAHLFWMRCGRRAAAVAACAAAAASRPRRCCCVLGWGCRAPLRGCAHTHLVIVCPEAAVCGLLCVCGHGIVCLVALWLFVGRATVSLCGHACMIWLAVYPVVCISRTTQVQAGQRQGVPAVLTHMHLLLPGS